MTAQFITDFHQAELNAERVMKSWGFTDAKATTGGADGGIDVRAAYALAQVKWKGGQAGRPEIQNLYGARGTAHEKQLFFFAASAYAKTAVDYADLVDVRLFLYDPLGNVEPANQRARDFLRQGGGKAGSSWHVKDDVLWLAAVCVGTMVGMILMALVLTK